MNEKHVELTSVFLDGELDHEAGDRALSVILDTGPGEFERFGRYCLIGDVMRGELTLLAHSVAPRVRSALRDEPAVLAPGRRGPARWLRPAVGLAVAASVAAAAVVVAPQLMTQNAPNAHPVQLAADSPRALPPPVMVAAVPAMERRADQPPVPGASRWQVLDKGVADRLNRLVIEHNEFGGRTGINGPVPHIGFVSYDAR